MSINVFVLRMSNPGFLELAQRDNIAIIGWAQLQGLHEFKAKSDLESQKRRERIKDVLRNSKWYDNERAIGNCAGSIDRFIYSVKNGDILLVPTFNGALVGKVDAPNQTTAGYDEQRKEADASYSWPVIWQKTIPRDRFRSEVVAALKSQHTCIQLESEYVADVVAAIERDHPYSLNDYINTNPGILNETMKAVAAVFSPAQFEEAVKKLLERDGARVSRYPTGHRGMKGDADLIAEFPVPHCGGVTGSLSVRVAYQLKKHQGQSDKQAVEQLIEFFKSQKMGESGFESFDRGVALTTAKFSDDAKRLCCDYNDRRDVSCDPQIDMLEGHDFARWILFGGLAALQDLSLSEGAIARQKKAS